MRHFSLRDRGEGVRPGELAPTLIWLVTAAVLAFPLSAIYLIFIGFSLPCLLANFYVRTVLKQYVGDGGAEEA